MIECKECGSKDIQYTIDVVTTVKCGDCGKVINWRGLHSTEI